MTDEAGRPCCRRICVDTDYFGEIYHSDDEHRWEPTRQTCCGRSESRFEQRACTCKSTRWVKRA